MEGESSDKSCTYARVYGEIVDNLTKITSRSARDKINALRNAMICLSQAKDRPNEEIWRKNTGMDANRSGIRLWL